MTVSSRLDERVAVVIGGGRGVGRATCVMLARAGARVVPAGPTSKHLEETANLVSDVTGDAYPMEVDIASWPSVEQLAGRVVDQLGRVDIVVVSAGVLGPAGSTWEVAPESWDRGLAVNLLGAFHAVRAFVPLMTKRGGVMVMVSSGAAVHPIPGWSSYCAGKAGLDHFVRTVASEIAQAGLPVRVHLVYPGVVDTEMQAEIRAIPPERFPLVERYRGYQRRGVLRPPEEPAELIWWLTTPAAAGLAGRAANIDDPEVRARVAADLRLPLLPGREG